MQLRALRVVEEDRVVADLRRPRIGEPPRVGRPLQAKRLESRMRNPVRALIDLSGTVRRRVVDPDSHRLIDERQLLAVRRPLRWIAEAGPERGDALLGARAVGRTERQLVLAAAIAPVGHGLPVGRPARIALRHTRRARHVDHRAEFRRHREDVAARLEDGALAGRRHRRPLMSDSTFAVLGRSVVSSVTTWTSTSAGFSVARSSR